MKTLKEALFSKRNIRSFDFLNDGRSFLIQTKSKNSDNIYTIIANEELTKLKNQLIVKVKCGRNKSIDLDIDSAEEWLSGKTKISELAKVDGITKSYYRDDTFNPDSVYLLEKDNFNLVLYNDFVVKNYADIEKATTILEKI